MIRSLTCALATVVGLSNGAAFAASDYTIPVDKDFWDGEVTWDSGLGRAYEYRWILTVIKDQMVVCGAGKYLDPTTRSNSLQVMRTAKVKLDGKAVMKNLSYFTILPKSGDLMSAKAACRSTGMAPPKGAKDVTIEYSGNYRF